MSNGEVVVFASRNMFHLRREYRKWLKIHSPGKTVGIRVTHRDTPVIVLNGGGSMDWEEFLWREYLRLTKKSQIEA